MFWVIPLSLRGSFFQRTLYYNYIYFDKGCQNKIKILTHTPTVHESVLCAYKPFGGSKNQEKNCQVTCALLEINMRQCMRKLHIFNRLNFATFTWILLTVWASFLHDTYRKYSHNYVSKFKWKVAKLCICTDEYQIVFKSMFLKKMQKFAVISQMYKAFSCLPPKILTSSVFWACSVV